MKCQKQVKNSIFFCNNTWWISQSNLRHVVSISVTFDIDPGPFLIIHPLELSLYHIYTCTPEREKERGGGREGAIHLATGTLPNHDTPQSTRRSREMLPCVVQHCTCSDVKSLIRASNRASLFSIIFLTLMFSFHLLTSPRCSYACVFTNPNWRMTTDSSCILSIIGNDEQRAISGHDHNRDETRPPGAKMHLIINQSSALVG